MKTYTKTIWFKLVSILVGVGLLFPPSAFAGDYKYQDVMPKYDDRVFVATAIATVALPFVPKIAGAIGGCLNLSQTATTTIGVGLGAGIGATPGLIGDSDLAAGIGAVSGGLSGGFGTNSYLSNLNTASTELSELSWLASAAEPGPLTGTIQAADVCAKLGHFSEAASLLGDAASLTSGITSSNLTAMSNVFNPIPQMTQKVAMSFATQQVSSFLVNAGAFSWGMDPREAQLLGMAGGSLTGWTMGSLTPGGKETMYNMYKDISPGLAGWARSDSIGKNVGAGAITGLGLGSLQAATNIELYDILASGNEKMPDTTKMQLASLGGQVLGSFAWSGLVGGGSRLMTRPTKVQFNTDSFYEGLAEGKTTPSVSIEMCKDSWYKKGITGVASDFGRGMWQGMKTVANEQFYKGLTHRGLSIGIECVALRNDMKPADASNLASNTSMLLANLRIWPHPARSDKEIEVLKASAEKMQAKAELYSHIKGDVKEGLERVDPLLAMGSDIMFENEIEAFENQAAKTLKQAKRFEGWHGLYRDTLREATSITKCKMVDAFLEPVVSASLTLAADNLREDKVEAVYGASSSKERNDARNDLLMHDLTAMNIVSLTHAGLVSLFNQKGWREGFDEFGQIHLGKQYDFSGDMLSFGSRAFGARTSRRKGEALSGYNIYGATQINSQMWNFAGLSNFTAQAERISDANRRMWMAKEDVPGNYFRAVSGSISSPSGGLAYNHTIRNAEGLVYTGIKNSRIIAPYELERINPDLAFKLEHGNVKQQAMLTETNRWIKEASYPATFAKEGINFQHWIIGEENTLKKDAMQLTLENTVTKVKYPDEDQIMLKALKELDVNKPFELVFPSSFMPVYRYKEPAVIFDFGKEKEVYKPVFPTPTVLKPPVPQVTTPNVEEAEPFIKIFSTPTGSRYNENPENYITEGPEVPKVTKRLFEHFNAENAEIDKVLQGLEGKINPVTGRAYKKPPQGVNWREKLTKDKVYDIYDEWVAAGFQHWKGIREDGDIGPETQAELQKTPTLPQLPSTPERQKGPFMPPPDKISPDEHKKLLTLPADKWEDISPKKFQEMLEKERREFERDPFMPSLSVTK